MRTIETLLTVQETQTSSAYEPPATTARVRLDGVHDADVKIGRSYAFDLRRLYIADSSDSRLWFNGPSGTLLYSSPIPEPSRFALAAADALHGLEAPRSFVEYAGAESFAELIERLESETQLRKGEHALVAGPLPAVRAVAAILGRAQVAHRIQEPPAQATKKYRSLTLAQLGWSWAVCESIIVDWPDTGRDKS